MVNKKYNHGNLYLKYNMDGDIKIGTGIVKVHDIFNPLPHFMLEADVVFSDPPYNQSALSGYYSKADMEKKQKFSDFFNIFMQRVREIDPKILILEIGAPQEQMYLDALSDYKNVISKEELYYNRGQCKILVASNETIPDFLLNLPEGIDEEKIIEMICKELDYKCIADLCMGTGLVGFYSNKYGKSFAGTELNKKRLAVLLERITTGERGNIK